MKHLTPLLASLLTLAFATQSQCADWYLHADQPGTDNWNTLADWWSTLEGSGSNPTSINSADVFHSNGCLVRTPSTSNAETFGGAALTLNGGTINVKSLSTTQPTTIGRLVSYGGTVVNATGNVQIVNITALENHSNTTISSGNSARGINLTVGTLSGNGDVTLNGNGTLLLTFNSAQNFYGAMYASGTTAITFQNAVVSQGPLIVPTGVVMTLNANVTFSGLTVGGTTKAAGTYSAASLGFGGTGSVIVRIPATWYLHASQPGTDSWSTLADWWSASTGGSNPTAINASDDFDTNGFSVRTPTSSGTFGGASLAVNAGTLILKGTSASVPAVIPNLIHAGSYITNSAGGVRPLNITDCAISGNCTFDTGNSTSGLNLSVTTLSGTGNINFLGHTGGQLLLNIANANNYTGSLSMANSSPGTLTFQNPLFCAGSLVVKAGNSVVVNQPVSFAGLNVSGTAKTAGTYTAASLGFTGAGTVTVTNRPAHMFGVNWSGMEGSTTIVPTDASLAYYAGKGLTLIRVPFKWERIQPVLNGALDPTQLGDLDTVLSRAASHGLKIILDMHNYGGYGSNQIGTTAVPYSAYQDVWTKLATHFAASPNASSVYGYDIMNEPNASSLDWPTAAQYGINGVRGGDSTRFILVEGQKFSAAAQWPKVNAGLINLSDPQKKIMYSAHCYFANSNNDQYGTYDAEAAYPNKGVNLVAPFVEWCKARGAYGHIGEYGVPNTDPRWNVVLQNFLQYLSDNDISGTYWAGGAVSVSYPLRCEPTSNFTVDEPQMAVLQLFHQ